MPIVGRLRVRVPRLANAPGFEASDDLGDAGGRYNKVFSDTKLPDNELRVLMHAGLAALDRIELMRG